MINNLEVLILLLYLIILLLSILLLSIKIMTKQTPNRDELRRLLEEFDFFMISSIDKSSLLSVYIFL